VVWGTLGYTRPASWDTVRRKHTKERKGYYTAPCRLDYGTRGRFRKEPGHHRPGDGKGAASPLLGDLEEGVLGKMVKSEKSQKEISSVAEGKESIKRTSYHWRNVHMMD